MMLQRASECQGLTHGPSSQTVSTWPLISREGDEQVIGQSVGYDIGSPTVQAPSGKTWDEAMDEVLSTYSEAWRRLAEL